mmetsp:Transcript_66857/g.157526  ORF Transcript_66857/g.157526 Transcript_66857/m.157526 type:complete len:314 (+) Transcript_66857:84-1025(+)
MDELFQPLRLYSATRSGKRYASPEFWDARFQEADGLFDWYATFEELKDAFEAYCPAAVCEKVLVVGCGNSALSAELHQAGYGDIASIDVSSAAIRKMQQEFASLPLKWMVMDATCMNFPSDTFRLSVDKGTLDAMMSSQEAAMAKAMCRQIWRVLQLQGIFILVSHSSNRMPLLREALSESGACEVAGTPAWHCVEMRRCRLSPQATLINILRSKLPPSGKLADAFNDPKLLQQATLEAKAALKRMAFIDAFRIFKERKKVQAGLVDPGREADEDVQDLSREEEIACGSTANEVRDPRLQPYCWIYVLRKVAR